MGIDTELVVAFELVGNPPKSVIDLLRLICGVEETYIGERTYVTRNFSLNMLNSSGGYFFVQNTNTQLYLDEVTGSYNLSARTVIKNYGKELDKFIFWIAPYVSNDGFIGYMRVGVEGEDFPTLIFIENHKAFFVDIQEQGRREIVFG